MLRREHAIQESHVDILAEPVKRLRGSGINRIADAAAGPWWPNNLAGRNGGSIFECYSLTPLQSSPEWSGRYPQSSGCFGLELSVTGMFFKTITETGDCVFQWTPQNAYLFIFISHFRTSFMPLNEVYGIIDEKPEHLAKLR
jgi:hypothetical protein